MIWVTRDVGSRIVTEGLTAIRNRCRRAGVQLGTVDALIAQLCIRHDLTLLTMDGDFASAAKHSDLEVWKPAIDPE